MTLPEPPNILLAHYGLNAEQQAVVTLPKTACVKVIAGAGTGKTRLIAHRFAQLVADFEAQGEPLAATRVFTVTFTEKAAAEMADRIAAVCSASMPGFSPDAAESSSWIGTFHELCARILRPHAPVLGLPEDFDILDTVGQTRIFRRLLADITTGKLADMQQTIQAVYPGLADCPPNLFAPETLAALPVNHVLGLLESFPRIIKQIKASGLSPEAFYRQSLRQTLDFSRAIETLPVCDLQTGEMFTDLYDYARLWDAHFARYKAEGFLFTGNLEAQEQYASKLAAEESFTETAFLREHLAWLLRFKVNDGHNVADAPFLEANFRRKQPFTPGSQQFDFLRAETQLECQLIAMLSVFYAAYQQQLLAQGACDFDDLINHCLQLFHQRPDILAQYQQQFLGFIVDEFQDTNGSQLALLEYLAQLRTQSEVHHSESPPAEPAPVPVMPVPVMIVGDEKQAIYGFRYAQPENLQNVLKQTPNVYQGQLQQNYRSSPAILSVVNAHTHSHLKLSQQNLLPALKTPDETSASSVPVMWLTFGYPNEPIADIQAREAQWLIAEIQQLLKNKRYTPCDIAILTRNHRKARQLEAALRQAGLPASRSKADGLFELPVIKNAMAFLRVVLALLQSAKLTHYLPDGHSSGSVPAGVSAQLAWVRLLQSVLNPLALAQGVMQESQAVEAKQEQVLLNWPDRLTFWQALTLEQPETFGTVLPVLRALEQAQQQAQASSGLTAQVAAILANGRVLWLKASDETNALTTDKLMAEAWQRFEELVLTEARKNPAQGLWGLEQTLRLYEELGELPSGQLTKSDLLKPDGIKPEEGIQILTIHAAKGLEFPVVFLALADPDRLRMPGGPILFDPQHAGKAGFGLILSQHSNQDSIKKLLYQAVWQKPRILQEQKRLFYVALSRAKERLYVLRARQSAYWTEAPDGLDSSDVYALAEVDFPDWFASYYSKPPRDLLP